MLGYYERALSPVGAGVLVLAALVIAGWWSARRNPEHMPAVIWTVVGAAGAFGLNQVAVRALAQARPYNVLRGVEVLVPRTAGYALPSGHAVVAGAVLCGLLLARRWRLALVALLAALLLLFAAVYVGAAYPSDVGGGAVAGVLVVLFLWPVASWLLLPVVAAIGASPLAGMVVASGSLKRPVRRPAKQLVVQRHSQKTLDAKAVDALRAASEAARNATLGPGAGKGR